MPFNFNKIDIPENGGAVFINGTEVEKVFINGVQSWSKKITPTAPTNFTASSTEIEVINFTWVLPTEQGIPICTYEIKNSAGTVVATATEGQTTASLAGVNSDTYQAFAVSSEGSTGSNESAGSSLAGAGSVTINYNSYTFTGNGENTVEIFNGFGTFTPLVGSPELVVAIYGAGGGGGGGASATEGCVSGCGDNGVAGTSGSAGAVIEETISPFISHIIEIGAGGANGIGGASNDRNEVNIGSNGANGGATIFEGATDATGGALGTGGTVHCGNDSACPQAPAGENSDIGIGGASGACGNGDIAGGTGHIGGPSAGGGAGGGGGGSQNSGGNRGEAGGNGGKGGNGQIVISWGA